MRRPSPVLPALALALAACTGSGEVPSATPSSSPSATADTPAALATPTPPAPDPDPTTLLMWARGGLPPDVVARARALPDVVAVAHVRSDTLALVGSRDADGRAVDDLDPGWQVPVEVSAVDPGAADLLAPGPARDAVAALTPGEVLLTESSAAQRGLGPGAQVDLAGRAGLVVAAVVPDDELGRDEVIVHVDDADALGMEPEGSVRVLHEADDATALASDLSALAPDDTAVRVVGAEDDAGAPQRAPLVLSLPEVKERFGEFAFRDDDADREIRVEPAWIDEHIVLAEVPLLGRVRCHEAIVEDLRGALQAVVDAGLGDTIDPDLYGGCYHARRIGDGPSLSRHSWGIAIDINVDISQPGLGPEPEPEVVEAFAAHGFRWGGLFLSPDNHHFEWVGDAALDDPPERRVGDTAG